MGMAGWRHPAPIPRRRLRRLGLEAFGACWFPRFIFRSRAPGKFSWQSGFSGNREIKLTMMMMVMTILVLPRDTSSPPVSVRPAHSCIGIETISPFFRREVRPF